MKLTLAAYLDSNWPSIYNQGWTCKQLEEKEKRALAATVERSLDKSPQEIFAVAVSNRNEIKLFETNLEIAKKNLEFNRSLLQPRLSANRLSLLDMLTNNDV